MKKSVDFNKFKSFFATDGDLRVNRYVFRLFYLQGLIRRKKLIKWT